MEFNCCTPRRIGNQEKKCKIKDLFRYDSLQNALIRLRSHPVAAGLACFEGWSDPKIYRGPLKEGAKYEGEHNVAMLDCTEIEGESVVICKSSNGEKVGFDGYIIVSLQVMLILAGATRKTSESPKSCHIRPQYLLLDFYFVDMDMSLSALIKEKPSREKKNRKFKVEDDEDFDDLRPPHN